MYKQVINKNDLVQIGYSEYMSKQIIKSARLYMVSLNHSYYKNIKVTTIPTHAVSKVLGFDVEILEVL